jgi:hypothetical protein
VGLRNACQHCLSVASWAGKMSKHAFLASDKT